MDHARRQVGDTIRARDRPRKAPGRMMSRLPLIAAGPADDRDNEGPIGVPGTVEGADDEAESQCKKPA